MVNDLERHELLAISSNFLGTSNDFTDLGNSYGYIQKQNIQTQAK